MRVKHVLGGLFALLVVSASEALGQNPGPDVIVGDLIGLAKYGYAAGGAVGGYSIGTTSCNIGTADLLWIANSNQHPVIAQNMYRLKDGRFEQIGQSWLKHGFTALTQNLCGTCNGHGGAVLGVGCSDPYSASLNGSQSGLGPRSEVNATTGYFIWPFGTRGQTGDAIYKRCQVHNDDLNPALNAGALYYAEGHYVTPDDAAAGNGLNNASYRPFAVGALTSTGYAMTFSGATVRTQPAIAAWKTQDASVNLGIVDVPADGEFYLGAKVTDLGGGAYAYEYALHNLNSHRSAGAFSIPVESDAAVTAIGFHDVAYHSGEPYDGTDWTASEVGDTLRWSTQTFAQNANANALRWGTLYNFRFVCNRAPARREATIGLFRPGAPDSVQVTTLAPACLADLDADGFLTGDDAILFATWFEAGDLRADLDGDGFLSGDDFQLFVTHFESGC